MLLNKKKDKVMLDLDLNELFANSELDSMSLKLPDSSLRNPSVISPGTILGLKDLLNCKEEKLINQYR